MKRFNPKGKPTKAELVHMDKVAQMLCCNCGAWGVQVNHITEGFRRLGNMYTIPLCPDCHAGVDAKGYEWEIQKCRETYKKLGLEFVEPVTKIVRKI